MQNTNQILDTLTSPRKLPRQDRFMLTRILTNVIVSSLRKKLNSSIQSKCLSAREDNEAISKTEISVISAKFALCNASFSRLFQLSAETFLTFSYF